MCSREESKCDIAIYEKYALRVINGVYGMYEVV